MFKEFLEGPGELKSMMRAKDWSETPVGEMRTWPQPLISTLGILLNSKFPMFLWWGPQKTQFYNDAYRPSMGNEGKHPGALGQDGKACWPEIWDIIEPLMEQVLTTGESTWSANQLIPIYRNGSLEDVYWTFSYSPVYNEEGSPYGVLVVCHETTSEMENLAAIKEAKDELEFTIEAAELGAWDLNPVTKKFKGNKRLKSWFGVGDDEEIELSSAINAIAEGDRERVLNAISDVLDPSSGGIYNIEYTIVNPGENTERIVRVKGKALFSDQGKPVKFSGIMQDITEECLRQKQKDDFIGIASHELKTPLTTLRTSLQLIERLKAKESDDPGLLNKFIDQSLKSVNKVSYLVEDLLNVTKLNAGYLNLDKDEFQLSELVNDCCQHTRFEGKHPIRVSGDLDIKVYADAHRIDQVLTNFINNAVKYDPDSGEIQIVIRRDEDRVKVSVKDHGPGIPAEKIPFLFDRYYRADDNAIMYSGLGLGLYICSEIIKRHDGEIGVESELGGGSTFWFSLPLESTRERDLK